MASWSNLFQILVNEKSSHGTTQIFFSLVAYFIVLYAV
jgi:hypothetical protein